MQISLTHRKCSSSLNLSTGYVSSQFHVDFNDNLETISVLEARLVPKRWYWLYKHKREIHFEDNSKILDNTKV